VVAGTVFKEISDKVYATRFFRDYKPENKEDIKPSAPDAGNGYRSDLNEVLKNLDINYRRTADDDWVATKESGDTVSLTGIKIQPGLVPDVRGMSMRDALYLLENKGIRVRYTGKGRVLRQSPEHGARYNEETVVSLELNM
jgi:cell division protein FtsI (penicillin-binding protein 3)